MTAMHSRTIEPQLEMFAGRKAQAILRDEGLRPERVTVWAGAAGGPKGLVLNGLDLFLMDFFARREKPLFLLGASIGAWRFLSAALGAAAHQRFTRAYMEQFYPRPPAPWEVTARSRQILKQLMGTARPETALAHPTYRLNILAARGRHLAGADRKAALALGLGAAMAANLADRRLLSCFFQRTLFFDPRDRPPFLDMHDLPSQAVALTEDNLIPATLASGAIPLLMQGVRDIPGAKPGTYWDGGITDYHIDIDYLGGGSGNDLVLFPHYSHRIIPGWLDKALFWRTPQSASRDHLVLLAPSRAFVSSLPMGKIPDRGDFKRFVGQDGLRLAYWRRTVAASRRLAEAFADAVNSGQIRHMVRPLPD